MSASAALHSVPARVDDVVDQDAVPVRHVADDVHDLRDTGPFTPLVDDGEVGVETARERPGPHNAADVRRDDHDLPVAVARAHVEVEDRGREQVVGRYVEEPLDLSGVKIQRPGHGRRRQR